MATAFIRTIKHGAVLVNWENIPEASDGDPYSPPAGYELKSLQVTGTFGGTSVTIQGTNEETPSVWVTDSSAATSAAVLVPTAQMLHFRPKTTGGTGSAIDINALFAPV